MSVTLNYRAIEILYIMAIGGVMSRSAIEEVANETHIGAMRELDRLIEYGYVSSSSKATTIQYRLTPKGQNRSGSY